MYFLFLNFPAGFKLVSTANYGKKLNFLILSWLCSWDNVALVTACADFLFLRTGCHLLDCWLLPDCISSAGEHSYKQLCLSLLNTPTCNTHSQTYFCLQEFRWFTLNAITAIFIFSLSSEWNQSDVSGIETNLSFFIAREKSKRSKLTSDLNLFFSFVTFSFFHPSDALVLIPWPSAPCSMFQREVMFIKSDSLQMTKFYVSRVI